MEDKIMEGKRSRIHMSMNIEGCLRNYKGKKIKIFTNDDGSQASDSEARQFLAECQAKGWKLIPMCDSDECPDFDHFGGGCPKHEIKEEFESTPYNQKWFDEMMELSRPTLESTFGVKSEGITKIAQIEAIREKLLLTQNV